MQSIDVVKKNIEEIKQILDDVYTKTKRKWYFENVDLSLVNGELQIRPSEEFIQQAREEERERCVARITRFIHPQDLGESTSKLEKELRKHLNTYKPRKKQKTNER